MRACQLDEALPLCERYKVRACSAGARHAGDFVGNAMTLYHLEDYDVQYVSAIWDGA